MKALLSLFTLAALSCAPAVQAGNLIDVGVVDRDTGATLPTYPRDGKYYVVGVPGHRYGVRLTNRSGGRVLAVLSVDGVNAVSGETASPDQTGYVLDAWQSTQIEGWRKSMNEVAQFNFTTLANSYATRTGRPGNLGVIGVAVFREKPRVWRENGVAQPPIADAARSDKQSTLAGRAAPASSPPAEADARRQAPASPALREKSEAAGSLASSDAVAKRRASDKPEDSIGTGFGERESSNVSYTHFERNSSRPDEIVSVWYDSYRNLVAVGVIPSPPPVYRDPQPFPNAFVPDPSR